MAQEETELERHKAALKRIIDLEGEWTPVPDETTGKPISDLEYGRWLGLQEAMHGRLLLGGPLGSHIDIES